MRRSGTLFSERALTAVLNHSCSSAASPRQACSRYRRWTLLKPCRVTLRSTSKRSSVQSVGRGKVLLTAGDERSLAGGQIVVDALDVLAEDYGSPKAVRILRCLLAAVKPGRVVLVLPPSQFLDDIVSAAVSPSAAHLTPHSPQLVETLARTYLLTGDEDKFFPILEAAAARRQGDALALNHGQGGDSIVLQVLLRKPAGGAKGITREVSGLRRAGDRWEVVGLSDVVDTALTTAAAETKSTTHADLNLPFNLSLTDQQRANRGAVPLPYAHEGEGADLSMGMDWEDEDEEDEL